MRWWRRNDGFEWKDYVRTTVLVRRQQRRDKLEAAKVAAVEGVKDAGRKGLAASAAGAEAAGQVAVKIARSAAEGAAQSADKGLALAVRAAAAARSRIAEASEPVNARLSHPHLARGLAAGALIAGAASAARTTQFGIDFDAALLGAVALVAGLLWVWPRLFAHSEVADDAWAVRTERAVAAVDRAGSWLPAGAAAVVAAAGLWFAAPFLSQWINTAAPPPEVAPAAKDSAAPTDSISGPARIAGAGLLKVGDATLRLQGVTLLDPAQTCRRADGTTWACGSAAQQALSRLTRRRSVRCAILGEADGVASATCTADGKDLASELIRDGHGFAQGFIWAAYSAEEAAAKEAKAGLWAGDAEQPEDWKRRVWEEASRVAPGGCPIKGRIQRNKKLYVTPHSADYAAFSPRADRGERWFCSEAEAETAGFTARDK